jgi:hypothetical protein
LCSLGIAAGTADAAQLTAGIADTTTDSPPANVVRPMIAGGTTLGDALTVSTGTWSGSQPFAFAYQWVRCTTERCVAIPGATGPSYTVGTADEIVGGEQVGLVAIVAAANSFGQAQVNSPVFWLDTPLAPPGDLGQAFEDAMAIYGTAGEIPELLAHGGYTAMYPALRTARVEIAWGLKNLTYFPKARRLADGRTVVQAGHVGSFQVRLTNFGRRELAGRTKLTVSVTLWYTPLGRNGRPCCGSGGTWGAQGTTFQIVLSASAFETRKTFSLAALG